MDAGNWAGRPVTPCCLGAVEPAEFADLGADFYTRRIDSTRRTHQLTRQPQALGYTVTLTDAAA